MAGGRPQVASLGSESPTAVGPVGVRGWLLFLCISLLTIGPLTLLAWARGPGAGLLQRGGSGVERLVCVAHTVVAGSLSVWCVVAGILLWTRRPNGAEVAKGFFAAWGFYALVLTMQLFTPLGTAIPESIGGPTLGMLILAGSWLAYLGRSKRVAATYGRRWPPASPSPTGERGHSRSNP